MIINDLKKLSFLLLLAVTFSLTSCKDDEVKLPAIGGYNTADEVAKANLLAYWGLDGNNKENISSTAANVEKNATYATGKKGQAVSLAEGFLAYPEIAALNGLKSFTVSVWANGLVNNKGTKDAASVLFSLSRANEWAGSVNLMAETGWRPATDDSVTVKGLIVSNEEAGASWQDSRNEISKGGDQVFVGGKSWAQYVMTYDATTEKFQIFANGKKISNPEWETRTGLGDIVVFSPSRVILGAWWTNLDGNTSEPWQKPFVGQIDEVRVYSKALSTADLSALYQLELAGR